jgi:ABC-2 type transport system ATP-binding protein
MIVLEGLTKEFGRTRAVSGVSFRAGQGEVIGLLGPNGSGKTTIMRALAGFFPPTSGELWLAGIDVVRDSLAAREQVGYLPENVALYPDMRVGQLLEFCADVRRLVGPHRRARLEEVMRRCGLLSVRRRLIGQLSKGFRQRVGLAQALLHDPAVLILDEPTVGLDPSQILEIRELIQALRGRTTVLLSTHILSEAASLCDRVVILDRGRVLAEGRSESLTDGLEETARTLVVADGPADEVKAILRGVAGVQAVEVEDGVARRFLVQSAPGEAVRAAINVALVERGFAPSELRPIVPTLEELFVRLLERREGEEGS